MGKAAKRTRISTPAHMCCYVLLCMAHINTKCLMNFSILTKRHYKLYLSVFNHLTFDEKQIVSPDIWCIYYIITMQSTCNVIIHSINGCWHVFQAMFPMYPLESSCCEEQPLKRSYAGIELTWQWHQWKDYVRTLFP